MELRNLQRAVNESVRNLRVARATITRSTQPIIRTAKAEISKLEYSNERIQGVLAGVDDKITASTLVSSAISMVGEEKARRLLSEISINDEGVIINLLPHSRVTGSGRSTLVIGERNAKTSERNVIKGRSVEARKLLELFAKISEKRNNKEMNDFKLEIKKLSDELVSFLNEFKIENGE